MPDTDVELLIRMLEIYSPSHEESRLSLYLSEEMTRRGFQAYQDPAGNAVGILGSGPRTVILLGHLDTVAGEIPVESRNGRLYGRGSVDAKGPLACFICAAHRLKAEIPFLGKRIVVIGAVEEEAATSRGARQAAADFSPPDFCVIGEPSRWDAITLGYKGRLLLTFDLSRPLKHTAAQGKLVCEEGVDFWNEVKSWCVRFNAGKRVFDTVDPSIRSINSRSDGLTEVVSMKLGFRLPLEFPVAPFQEFLTQAGGEGRCVFSGQETAVRMDKSNDLVKAFLRSIREHQGTPRFKVKTGTADMNVVAPVWQCPMVAYGPGDSALDHTPEEHIEIEEYTKAINVLESVLRTI